MSDPTTPVLHGVIVEDEIRFTLDELGRACRAERSQLVALVEEGVLHPAGSRPAGRPLRQPALLLLVALNLGYASLAWLALRLVYGRTGRLDLSLAFLHLDVLLWLLNLHHVEQSHLFFAYLLLIRVADQVGFGFR